MKKRYLKTVVLLLTGMCLFVSCSDDDKDEDKNSLTVGEQVTIKTGETVGLVDLGLPSGTKWADRNIGATSQISYGDFYAWSETTTKETYEESNYVGLNYESIKSTTNIAGTKYDAATVVWGEGWSMPTLKQYLELIDECDWTWMKIDKVYGQKVVGPNGNSIFIPAAGVIENDIHYGRGSEGWYYCTEIYNKYDRIIEPYMLAFEAGAPEISMNSAELGQNIRPVMSK